MHTVRKLRAATAPTCALRAMRGFSLLEVLVAFSIMAMALGALYHSVGSSVNATLRGEYQSRAAVAANALLSLYATAPPEGVAASGLTPDGMAWTARSVPLEEGDASPAPRRLHRLEISLAWQESGRERVFAVATLVPEVTP